MSYKKILCVLFLSVLFLGCGWKPVYYQKQTSYHNTAVVEIAPIPNADGRLMMQKLKDILNPQNQEVVQTALLSVSLKEELDTEQGIIGDNTSTRATMRLTASFILKDKKTEKILLDESTFAVSSYNILWLPYPTTTAQQATRQRLIETLANQVGMRIAVYFSEEKSDK